MHAEPSRTGQAPITLAGCPMVLDAAAALWIVDEEALVVSDLHLEKGSFLGQFGVPLPHYDTLDTLGRLTLLLGKYRPKHVVLLGDTFHDRHALARLTKVDTERLENMAAAVTSWHWVSGNHDAAVSHQLPGIVCPSLILNNLHLTHQPEALPMGTTAQVAGHFHPKLKLFLGGRRVSGKAFVQDDKRLILPAFGTYTGGLEVSHPAISALFEQPRYHLIYNGSVWPIASVANHGRE